MTTNTIDIRVYFEDTDFTGRVYHGAFVRFLERGRTEWLRSLGINHLMLAAGDKPVYFTIRNMSLNFRGPALIDDLLTVESEPRASRATMIFRQRVLKGDQLLVSAEVELCLIDAAGRPVRPPREIVALMGES